MNVRYMGVYWTPRKDELPEDGTMCVFHLKRRVASSISFGWYGFGNFYENNNAYAEKLVDYWMPIPILPAEEGVK